MKTIGTALAVVFGAALCATAGPPPQTPSASQTVNTNAIPSRLESLQPAPKGKVEIYRAGNMSSRPWTEIVGWHPGVSQFPDGHNHEPQLTLLTWNFGSGSHRSSATSTRP